VERGETARTGVVGGRNQQRPCAAVGLARQSCIAKRTGHRRDSDTAAQTAIKRVEVDYGKIVIGLILLVVLPIVVAQVLRQRRAIGSWATRHKHPLSYVAQCGVLWMVSIGAVNCGDKLAQASNGSVLSAGNVILMITAVTTVHIILLLSGFGMAGALRFTRGDTIAVAMRRSW
jgi:predicted Na+-dependent transporter